MTRSSDAVYDLFIIGGGINGVGIAVDAAGRGLKVGLCEKSDLAGATSSASSKLIHGGLRYLEHYEFRLVKEALAERETLLKLAPHIAKPLRFCLPHRPQLRPAWMIRIGLFLYDNLSRRTTLEGCTGVKFSKSSPLKSTFKKGFEYSDAWVDDARLVVLNALKLQALGGTVQTRTEVTSARRKGNLWHVKLKDHFNRTEQVIKTKGLVNAAGPWVNSVMEGTLNRPSPHGITLVKGSHIIVPKIHDESRAYILQNEDQRIVFVLPYQDNFSIVGTTDVKHTGDPAKVSCADEEIEYLCKVVNQHFTKQISPSDVVWTYSGVRPLCDDESDSPQAITRDYTMEIEDQDGQAPLLAVFGGKLTTYRKLGEAAVNRLAKYYPEASSQWTANSQLPGAEGMTSAQQFATELTQKYPWLNPEQARRFSTSYGSLAHKFLENCQSENDMGEHFGGGLTQVEVDYLMAGEWAYKAEDILWRRSKLGLHVDELGLRKLQGYMKQQLPSVLKHRFQTTDMTLNKAV